MITKSLFVENFDLIESARDLLRIRSRFSTLDDAFRDDALVLKCLMELTDCDKKNCRKAMQVAYEMEARLNAQEI